MNTKSKMVAVVVVTYGKRLHFLKQTTEVVLRNPHVSRLIVVDNGSQYEQEIREHFSSCGNRVKIIRHEKNLGSAGGFAAGISVVRKECADFVYLTDDDLVPDEDFCERFLQNLTLFPNKDVVLCGVRSNLPDNFSYFYQSSVRGSVPRKTFFDVLSVYKLVYFLKRFTRKGAMSIFVPIVPSAAFVYGGAFLPMKAVLEAPLPDVSLFLYGDDVEYSWNIKDLGYSSYLCISPKVRDIDFTFADNSSHLWGQFDEKTPAFKVYYRMRNMVLLSRRYKVQWRVVLFLNILIWSLGLFAGGLIRVGPTRTYFSRVKLLSRSIYAGYVPRGRVARDTEAFFGL